ncbi:hypothetical protein ABC347_08655 [Sphingomonas sp. 1P06PA]
MGFQDRAADHQPHAQAIGLAGGEGVKSRSAILGAMPDPVSRT